jgi:nicotinamidase-related amidase
MGKGLDADYVGAGFGGRLGFGRSPALVVIDFCNAYTSPGSPLYAGEGIEAVRRAAVSLLKAARAARTPVFHTMVRYAKGGADGGVFFRKVKPLRLFEEGADPHLQDYAKGLRPKAGEPIIVKQYASAFFGTSFASTLTAAGVDTLMIVGVSTSGCVRATALDACQHGFIPIVVRDAVGDRDPRVHDANLFDLAAKYADVVRLDEALGAFAALAPKA